MNYAAIKSYDVANGPGVRVSLFVSGCTHRCKGCFNAEAWDFNYGEPFTPQVEEQIIAYLKPWYIRGFSLLGGEPFHPRNQKAVLDLVRQVRERFPGKDIWCYTGYLYEDLLADKVGEYGRALLEQLDVLVDGPFIEAQKDLTLRFRGSANQRIIDVPASLWEKTVLLWDDNS